MRKGERKPYSITYPICIVNFQLHRKASVEKLHLLAPNARFKNENQLKVCELKSILFIPIANLIFKLKSSQPNQHSRKLSQ